MLIQLPYICLLLFHIWGSPYKAPVAKDGILDLSHWDLQEKGAVNLNGEWELYWGQLLFPCDFDSSILEKDNYLNMPSVWNKTEFEGEKLPKYGYATFRLNVKLNNNNELYAIKMGEVFTAYRIFINKQEIIKVGTPGKDKATSIPQFYPHVTPFKIEGDEMEIVFQISNFHLKKGGVNVPVKFGLERQLRVSREKSLVVHFVLFGSVLIMGLYHLSLLHLSRYKKTSLLFGVFCLLIGLRNLVVDESILTYLIPAIKWQVHIKTIVLGYYLCFLVAISFIYQLYKEEAFKPIISFFQYTGTILSLVVLFTPASVYGYTELYYQVIILFGIAYMLFIICKAVKNKKNGAVLVLIGMSVLFAVTINDVLYAQNISNFQNLLPYGLFVFILLQSHILAKHFSQAVSLSEELAIVNNKLHESNETKDKFFSIIAHDLKGPIGIIANVLEYTREGKLTPKMLSHLKTSARNTYNLLQDLLTWAQTQREQIEIEPINFNIIKQLKRLVSSVEYSAHQKKIHVSVSNEENDLFVYADLPSINTVLRNLVSNAIKFTEQNGTIELSAAVSGKKIKIEVKDSGIGMPKEKIPELFELGGAVSSPGTMNEKGTGLGLLLCKEFVDRNNGEIFVESGLGKGSTFWFTLPIGEQFDEESELKLIEKQQLKALVVGDYLNSQDANRVLNMANINCTIANDGKEAVKIAASQRFDFILMDIDTPKIRTDANREVREKYRDVRIIALSSYSKAEILKKDKDVIFEGYLKKPLTLNDLMRTLDRFYE